jgi:hypothetical protein
MKKVFSLLLIAFFSAFAHAETGTVESISGGFYQLTTNDFGDSKYTVLVTKLAGTNLKSDVSFIKQGTSFVAECAGSSITDTKGNKVDGTCLVTDSDGDKYKLNFSRSNAIGGNNPGVQSWVGMTGKYVGATGNCTYENKSQVLNGVVYATNAVKCSVSK